MSNWRMSNEGVGMSQEGSCAKEVHYSPAMRSVFLLTSINVVAPSHSQHQDPRNSRPLWLNILRSRVLRMISQKQSPGAEQRAKRYQLEVSEKTCL